MLTDFHFISIEDLDAYEVANGISPSVVHTFKNEAQPLEHYLINVALQESKNNVGKTCVYIKDDFSEIAGFYTLSTSSIQRKEIRGQFPYPEIPSILIGRLGRNISHKKMGVGEDLIVHAFSSIVDFSNRIGVRMILVDAKDKAAKDFYESFGFKKIKSAVIGQYPERLYLSVDTARAALA